MTEDDDGPKEGMPGEGVFKIMFGIAVGIWIAGALIGFLELTRIN